MIHFKVLSEFYQKKETIFQVFLLLSNKSVYSCTVFENVFYHEGALGGKVA